MSKTRGSRIQGGFMLAHWADVAQDHATVLAFLEWLETEYGIGLDYDNVSSDKPAPLDRSKLVDEFFGVDRAQLEADRRALLDSHGRKYGEKQGGV